MKTFNKTVPVFLLALCGWLLPSGYCDPAPAKEKAVRVVTFLTLAGTSTVDPNDPGASDYHTLEVLEGKTYTSLSLSADAPSSAFKLPLTPTITLFEPGADPTVHVPVVTVSIPADWTNVLVLLSRKRLGGGPNSYQARAFNQSPTNIGPGNLLVYNLAPFPTAVRLRGAQGIVPPAGKLILPIGTTEGMSLARLDIAVQENGGEEWRRAVAQNVGLQSNPQAVAFVYPVSDERRVALFISSDSPADPPPPPKS